VPVAVHSRQNGVMTRQHNCQFPTSGHSSIKLTGAICHGSFVSMELDSSLVMSRQIVTMH